MKLSFIIVFILNLYIQIKEISCCNDSDPYSCSHDTDYNKCMANSCNFIFDSGKNDYRCKDTSLQDKCPNLSNNGCTTENTCLYTKEGFKNPQYGSTAQSILLFN